MKTVVSVWVMAITLLLAGCSKPGNEYAGTWQNVDNEKETLIITRSEGDMFIVVRTAPSLWTGNIKTEQIPAVYKDNLLQVQQGFMAFSFFIDKSTGQLSNGKTQYKKIE